MSTSHILAITSILTLSAFYIFNIGFEENINDNRWPAIQKHTNIPAVKLNNSKTSLEISRLNQTHQKEKELIITKAEIITAEQIPTLHPFDENSELITNLQEDGLSKEEIDDILSAVKPDIDEHQNYEAEDLASEDLQDQISSNLYNSDISEMEVSEALEAIYPSPNQESYDEEGYEETIADLNDSGISATEIENALSAIFPDNIADY